MYESYINKIEDVGKLRNLKPGTIRIYKNNVTQFLEFIQKDPEDLTCKDASDFLLYLKNKGDKSSTLNNKARIESPYISATRTRLCSLWQLQDPFLHSRKALLLLLLCF